MKNKPNSDITYLRWYAARGIARAHNKGYLWFKERFLPALLRLEAKSKHSLQEKEVLADAYYLLGDIHDFNDAPKQALKAYKKSISHFPNPSYASGAWRELGSMYHRLGHYKSALKAVKRALSICPNDSNAQFDLEFLLDDISSEEEPDWDAKSPHNKARDLLAQQKAKRALAHLADCELTIEARLLRACCFGQIGAYETYLEEWASLARGEGFVELNYIDWFYMPDKVKDEPEIWEFMLQIAKADRFISGIFLDCVGLRDYYPLPRKVALESAKHRKATNDAYGEMCRYRVALAKDDLPTLKTLAKRYPKWKLVNEGIELVKKCIARKKRRRR